MTLPAITIPSSLPPFLAKTHDLEFLALFADVPAQAGHGRRRQLFTPGGPRVLSFEMDLTQDQMTVFENWFETVLLAGERQFSALMANRGPGLRWFAAKFVEPYVPAADDAGNWRVTGKLLLTGKGSATAPPPGSLGLAVAIPLTGSASLRVQKPLALAVSIALLPPPNVTGTGVGTIHGFGVAAGRNSGISVSYGTVVGTSTVLGRARSVGRVIGTSIVTGISPAVADYPFDSYLTNLLAVGGMRRLVSAYSGNAIRVRRSSDDTEQDIAFAGDAIDVSGLLSFTGAANAYANWGKVALYMPITGSSGSTAFRCVKGHAAAAVGNAQVSTALGFPTALFDGTGDRIEIVSGMDVQLGGGDFRIRLKIRAATLAVKDLVGSFGAGSSTSMFFMNLNNTSGQLVAGIYSGGGTAGVCTSGNVIATGTTYDIEYGRSGSSFQLSVDGVSVATATSSSVANTSPGVIQVGGEATGFSFDGHIWGLSIEPGVAGHLGSFTPDALYTNQGDGYVSKIYYQNTSGYLGQSAVDSQPRIVNNAVVLQDIHFNGAGDHLIASANGGTPTGLTVFVKGNAWADTVAGVGWNIAQLTADFGNNNSAYIDGLHSNGFGWGVSQGTGNNLAAKQATATDIRTLGVVAGLFDKTASTTAKRRIFYNGTELTAGTTSGNGTVGTAAFTAGAWYLGGLPSDPASATPLNFHQFAIYEAAKTTTDISAITTILRKSLSTGRSAGSAVVTGPSLNDPHWSQVELLLHFDGVDGAQVTTDSSSHNRTIAFSGGTGAQLDTSMTLLNGACLQLAGGTGDFIYAPNAVLHFGASDFTVECWVRANTIPGSGEATIISNYGSSGSRGFDIRFASASGGILSSRWSFDGATDAGFASGPSAVVANTVYHIAVVRHGGSITAYLNGVGGTPNTTLGTTAISASSMGAYIGVTPDSPTVWAFDGRVDELRVTNGFARYTANFTPPTAPFPNT